MTISRPPDRRGFQIALVCALPLEADAVIALLDHHWEDAERVYGKALGDPNAYTTGAIGTHNVVVAHMPHMGKTSAAAVAVGLRTSFPNLKIALVVGVCGGVPTGPKHKREIYLGDVIISESLVEYDFGRQYPTGFEPKDAVEGGLGGPSVIIQSILRKLETDHHHQRLEKETQLAFQGIESGPGGEKYVYPGWESDRLFQPSYLHQHRDANICSVCAPDGSRVCSEAMRAACDEVGCEKNGLVPRKRLFNDSSETVFLPSIHIGRMGSGDTVMKSGLHRDELARRQGIIGLEMEGAGVCMLFPGLVIKGVCDYADSHKNKRWQERAAAAAAACAKAFLLQSWISEDMASGLESAKSVYMVEIERDDQFIGREDVMQSLIEKLSMHHRLALVALGGMGKSRIALEYAMKFKSSPVSVFWIHASSKRRLLSAYAKIAKRVSIVGYKENDGHSAYLVKEWFESEASGRWLIVLDNVDEHTMLYGPDRLEDILPRSDKGSIIMTTRDKRVGLDFTGGSSRLILLDRLAPERAEDLLVSKLGDPSRGSDAVKALVEELEGVPLAIVQASAFMESNCMEPEEYLQLYRESPEWQIDLLSEDFEDGLRDRDSSKNPIATTWFISFDYIDRNFPLAGELLKRMSLLDSHAVPVALLTETDKPSLALIKALGTLQSFFLISPRTAPAGEKALIKGTAAYDLHRLVRLAMQNWLKQHNQMTLWTARMLKLASSKYPDIREKAWSLFSRGRAYLPHAVSLLSLDEINCTETQVGPSFVSQKDIKGHAPDDTPCGECAATLMQKLTTTCGYANNFRDQHDWARKEIQLRTWVSGPDDELTVLAMFDAATALHGLNEMKEAEVVAVQMLQIMETIDMSPAVEARKYELLGHLHIRSQTSGITGLHEYFERAVELSLQVFPPEHGDVMRIKGWLGYAYSIEGRFQEAEAVFKDLIALYDRFPGAMGVESMGPRFMLLAVYRETGREEEAVALDKKLAKLGVGVTEGDSVATAMRLGWSGQVNFRVAKYNTASALLRQCMALGTEAKNDTLRLSAMTVLTVVCQRLEQYTEAESLAVQVLEAHIRLSGDHSDTVNAMMRLANLYEDAGQDLKAYPIRERIAEIEEKRMGSNSCAACLSRCELGVNLIFQGQYAEAEQYQYGAVNYPLEAENAQHPEHISRMLLIADRLTTPHDRHADYLLEAEQIARDAVKLARSRKGGLLGDARGVDMLGIICRILHKSAEAELLLRENLGILTGKSQNDWRIPGAMISLALTFLQQRRYPVAEDMARDALTRQKQHPEPRQVDLNECEEILARVYVKQGNFKAAGLLLCDLLQYEAKRAWEAETPRLSAFLNTLGLLEAVASIFSGMESWDNAARIFEKVHSIRCELVGSTDLSTLRVGILHRNVLNSQGYFMEALMLGLDYKDRYRQQRPQSRSAILPEQVIAGRIDRGLAESYAGLGDFATAESLGRDVLQGMTDALGENDPESIEAAAILAGALMLQNEKQEEALSLKRRVLNVWTNLSGEECPQSIKALEALVRSCQAVGEETEARELFEKAKILKEKLAEQSLDTAEVESLDQLAWQILRAWDEKVELAISALERRRKEVCAIALP